MEHTQRVQLELATVESLLKDAETGQRGFLYTGEPRYLGPYDIAVKQVDAHIDRLAELVKDNPQQHPRIPRLRTLTNRSWTSWQQTDRAHERRQAKSRPGALVLSDLGKRIMDDIRALMAAMSLDENSLEAAACKRWRRAPSR